MTDKKAIIFDLGGTLLHLDYPFIAKHLLEHGIEVSEESFFRSVSCVNYKLEHVLKSQPTSTDASRWSIYFQYLLEEFHAPFNYESFINDVLRPRHQSHNLWNYVLPGTTELLKELKKQYRLAMISNSDGRAEEKTIQYNLREYLEFVIDSQFVGVEKPNKKIFEIALNQLQLKPSECFYIGDIYSIDVVGARASGITPVLLNKADNHHYDCLSISKLSDIHSLL
ncbi:HAD-superfamily hydrolase, subfamily IA, variant 1 [Chloroherpeton thalassium ATCC 35110]|uniref:HAD-superfamily hydrolase, subfamily IA, variant 1 n=1 Tax=Chloroherpeton thalassium (strain ATCC 35110 / GB-78) TaxID=517418 RepID=B3QVZ5_CHLT3|nr:HAD family hydrolase [Chloroherpeton thalassium]ACF14649.1 HAD-superfamily hydrolase, subfamily IA, variant 1 [Chloroherpeton thalassium ATCC 35110]